ncbi:hypothetical protein [Anabaena catenula]|uniref:Cthe-2314-like HEPN domain-containing protein n=1 Tax=Anabaena catenula FACHB-362 TaxID=2692877 RepID=A0ABR8J718_9NOST|nr:hypothetical protein [Anabaena catenula]MBD2694179.1 hypothetical protein [Anabaena catenula FACHB-362]
MRISRTIDELVFKVQIYNIPLLPIEQPLTFLDLKDAIQTSEDILYHLHVEEYTSYQDFKYKEAIKEFGISSDGVINYENLTLVPDALLWVHQFRSTFLSRFSTYTMTICGLDKMLEKTYIKFLEALKNTQYNNLIPNEPEESLNKRLKEIKHYTKLRNKVFAHTSYAIPQNDSEELQSASLAFYSGRSMRYAEDHVYMQIGFPLIKTNDQIELRIFKDFSDTIIPHYNEWATMFTEILVKLPT